MPNQRYVAMDREAKAAWREENADPEFWKALHAEVAQEEDVEDAPGSTQSLRRAVMRLLWIEKERAQAEKYAAEEQL